MTNQEKLEKLMNEVFTLNNSDFYKLNILQNKDGCYIIEHDNDIWKFNIKYDMINTPTYNIYYNDTHIDFKFPKDCNSFISINPTEKYYVLYINMLYDVISNKNLSDFNLLVYINKEVNEKFIFNKVIDYTYLPIKEEYGIVNIDLSVKQQLNIIIKIKEVNGCCNYDILVNNFIYRFNTIFYECIKSILDRLRECCFKMIRERQDAAIMPVIV